MIMRTKSFETSLPKMELTKWKEMPYRKVILAVLNLIPIIKTELGMWSRRPRLLSSFICSLAAYVINAVERKCQINSPPHLINRKCRKCSITHYAFESLLSEKHTYTQTAEISSLRRRYRWMIFPLCRYELWSIQTDYATYITVTQFSCHHHQVPSLCRLCRSQWMNEWVINQSVPTLNVF